ncbi:MAG: hypothetical protein IT350_06010 [Deltaproteobacteria bacterium]|nr:hypothetical protein [Deltaproteobacteria bacterium]
MMKPLALAAAAFMVLGIVLAGFATAPEDAGDCPDVNSLCFDKVMYLYVECNLFLYDPESGEPIDVEDLVADCQAGTNDWVNAVMNCIAVFCGDGCEKVGECIEEVIGDDDETADDDATDDDTDDDWLNDDETDDDGDDDSDDLWDDDDEGDDDTTAPTPAPKSDDDDDDDPYAWCA